MKIAVSISVGVEPLTEQVQEVLDVLEGLDVDPVVILAGHLTLDPSGCNLAREAVSMFSSEVVRTAFADAGTFSRAYLAGWQEGVSVKADFVVSMDADGSHDPKELAGFIKKFRDGNNAVFSSRFLPYAENKYPPQRRLISLIGTKMVNAFLTPDGGVHLTDFTSGYEGLSREIVQDILKRYPPEQWVSVTHGPYHLQNTILRLLVLQAGYPVCEIPIRYGIRHRGKNLEVGCVAKAFRGFLVLLSEKKAGKMYGQPS